ncbi:hypothetical protein NECAME_07392 [Necator americanus]|uniref:Uncharacterized protein n=1 Tax=Necator americanus TaxID=51031 RepID=W2TQN8_NECAM|nr:hypothetical protein NECAME_07392 [Necator americanus]ETN83436.1 hypothetical protein NECAME_07392 [Necator americanus]
MTIDEKFENFNKDYQNISLINKLSSKTK